ncbi:MAG: DUF475 domain-containing protein [Candidatus Aenigmarchaeota archaeon]|nr:DUF475 domain-containing protein [Candidatus Aenigmarchaeota archaeon]
MDFDAIFIIIGLGLFEMITSIDNAVINAEVLSTVSQKMRRLFLTWGIFFAVFVMRGLLPLIIVMLSHPGIGLAEAITFSAEESAIESSSSVLLIAGGVFLVFVFLNWLFMEPKAYGLGIERRLQDFNVWFYAVVSVFLAALVWFAADKDGMMAFGAVLGSTIFFIVHGFRLNAEKMEQEMMHKKGMSDWSKIFYLEAIDASFSIDGVIGAFAFTMSVPLIILGNGLGAIAVRQLTVANIDRIKKYKYLKHGAMYSILILGAVMIAESFGWHAPSWLSPLAAIAVMGYFFRRSVKEMGA